MVKRAIARFTCSALVAGGPVECRRRATFVVRIPGLDRYRCGPHKRITARLNPTATVEPIGGRNGTASAAR